MTRAQAQAYRDKITTAANNLPDDKALDCLELFEPWSGYRDYVAGDRVRVGDKLYRCNNAISANPTWQPENVPAHWEPVTVGEDGTLDNPITAAAGMRYYKDLYYADSGKVYKCTRDDSNGQGTILHYVPSQLINIYFEEVTT